LGKAITFMLFVWFMVSIGGSVMQGSVSAATTELTADIDDTIKIITVRSTNGFPDTGFIQILDERIGYSSKTPYTFEGNLAQPTVRGANSTEAVAHSDGELVRTVESSMLNQSLGYKLAVLSDTSGLIAFVTIPLNFILLLVSFLVLPLSFMGTDLEILTYIWGIIGIGILVSIGIALAGGRNV
jgi:hypothetical protein